MLHFACVLLCLFIHSLVQVLLETLSVHFGIMLSNCLTYEKEMAEVRKSHALQQLKNLVGGVKDEDLSLLALCRRITDLGKQVLKCDRASIFMVDYQRRELWSASVQDEDQECIFVPIDQGAITQQAFTRIVLVLISVPFGRACTCVMQALPVTWRAPAPV